MSARNSLVWAFDDREDANECAAAMHEDASRAFEVRTVSEHGDTTYDVHVTGRDATGEDRAFAVGFAAARNVDSMRENPIARTVAIAAARGMAHVLASGSAPPVAYARVLARYVLGLTEAGAAADILGALPEVQP